MTKNILLVEDDQQMQELISTYLTKFEINSFIAPDAKTAMELFNKHKSNIDLIVLDLMLPDIDGFDLCKEFKKASNIPIIISSARGDIGNKIYGFEIGVEDYLAKPYEPRELVLRIEAVLKRTKKLNITSNSIELYDDSLEANIDGYRVSLTKIEFEILKFFIQNPKRAISREELKNILNLSHDTKNRVIDMHISNLRYKIGDDSKNPKYIKSIWGIGYKFSDEY